MSELKKASHGKKPNQKLKAYLVYEYLKQNTDEENFVSATDIVGYLQERGIEAERRSIYRDIEDINKLFYLLENEEADMDEAEEEIETDEDNELKAIVYDKSKKGFHVKRRLDYENDIRLLAECVYATKFINQDTSTTLIDTICRLVSDYQADRIRHDVFLVDRVKTNNNKIFVTIDTINDAMNYRENDVRKPQKIRFHYLTYNIDDLEKKTYRRKGQYYKVSPFQLIINDGNYYLFGFDEKTKKMMTYRIDRMEDAEVVYEPREGAEEFEIVDPSHVFNMFKGEKRRVKLLCVSSMLDTMIERFGTKAAHYKQVDKNHFTVEVEAEISDQFFGWLLGFGTKVILKEPKDVVSEFRTYVKKVLQRY